MAYILAANPNILKNAGMPEAALVTATALSAAVATALMDARLVEADSKRETSR